MGYYDFKQSVNTLRANGWMYLQRIKNRLHKKLITLYIILTICFMALTLIFYYPTFATPIENPPKQPIIIGAGAGDIRNFVIDKTSVTFYVPSKMIRIMVTLNITQEDTGTYFFYALLPFTVSNVSSYSEYSPYHQIPEDTGISDCHFLNTAEGLAVINASIQLSSPFYVETRITIVAMVRVNESLLAIDDSNGGRETVIYTFFGGNSNWTEEMGAFRTPISQQCLYAPFVVQIQLPSTYYFSSSQPAPIEYYVNKDSRFIMFSMDFLNGEYAQTLVCNFENPSIQSIREFNIFLVGVFVTLSITFGLEAVMQVVSACVKKNNF